MRIVAKVLARGAAKQNGGCSHMLAKTKMMKKVLARGTAEATRAEKMLLTARNRPKTRRTLQQRRSRTRLSNPRLKWRKHNRIWINCYRWRWWRFIRCWSY